MATKYLVKNLVYSTQLGPFASLMYTNHASIDAAIASGLNLFSIRTNKDGTWQIENPAGVLCFAVVELPGNAVGRPRSTEQPSGAVPKQMGRPSATGWNNATTAELPQALLTKTFAQAYGTNIKNERNYYLAYTDANQHLLSPITKICSAKLNGVDEACALAIEMLTKQPTSAIKAFIVSSFTSVPVVLKKKTLLASAMALTEQPEIDIPGARTSMFPEGWGTPEYLKTNK